MIRAGILTDEDPVELLEGWLVRKMPKNIDHANANEAVREGLLALLPAGWSIRSQNPITLRDSE
ncbi:MAG TPA: hypothetical protein VK137_04210, partial [Planctomycetaceae bacterium]|nr:hypothetical protein [Planctomycetaceae bacterium]